MRCTSTASRSPRSSRLAAACRLESLEARQLYSATVDNNTFDTATVVPDQTLEQNYSVADSVNASAPDAFYKFHTTYGPSHLYAALDALSADADLYVFDQNQDVVAESTKAGTASETINVDLQGDKDYYVRVHAYAGSPNYSLFLYNDYAGSTLDTARDQGTSLGQSTDGSYFGAGDKISFNDYLDYRDNVDVVKFKVEAPGTVSLRMKDFTYSGGLVAHLELLDSEGSVIADGGTGSVGDGLNIDRFTVQPGTYYARYTQISGSDPYVYRIVTDYAGDRTGTARDWGDVTNRSRSAVDMVGNAFGLPTYGDQTDLYKFALDKTSPVDLRSYFNTSAFSTPTFGLNLQLAQDSNGDGFIESNEILDNGAAGSSGEQTISRTLNAGTYYAVVTQNGAYTQYQLDLNSDLDNVPTDIYNNTNLSKAQNLGSLVGETYVSGGFDDSADRDFTDFYKFTMSAAGTFSASALVDGYSRSTQTPAFQLSQDLNNNGRYDAGEAVVPFASGSFAKSLAAGTYYLTVYNNGDQENYEVRTVSDYAGNTLANARALAAVPANAASSQTFKDYAEEDFGAGSDVDDFYRFDLAATQAVTLKTTGVAGEDLSLALIKDANNNGVVDAGDTLVTSQVTDSPNESITRTLGAGRYFVRVHGVNGGTNYTLTSAFAAATAAADNDGTIATATAKALGQSADFSLSPANDVDFVKVTVAAGQRVSFDVDSRDGSNLDTYLRLFKADGTQLAANNDGAAPGEAASKFSYLEYTFAQAGTYYLGVSLNGNTAYNPVTGAGKVNAPGATGEYHLAINNLGTTAPTVLRVDAGGPSLVAGNGQFFEADNGFTGTSTTATAPFAVDGTTDDALFYTSRSGANFAFAKTVANGTYQLTLDFAENTYTAAGKRKFNVFAEGKQILSNFDIYAAAGAAKKAVAKTFTVAVNDGKINLGFVGTLGAAEISGFSLVKQ